MNGTVVEADESRILVYVLFLILFIGGFNIGSYASFEVENDLIKILDSNLKVEKFVEGLDGPTTMAFVGPSDVLVLEKDRGTVRRIESGVIQQEPISTLEVDMSRVVEACLV
jgi:hypothetical protein